MVPDNKICARVDCHPSEPDLIISGSIELFNPPMKRNDYKRINLLCFSDFIAYGILKGIMRKERLGIFVPEP